MKPVELLRQNLPRAIGAALILVLGLTALVPPASAAPQASFRQTATAPQASSQQTAAAPQPELPDPNRGVIDRVLLRVSGQAILFSEFEARLAEQLSLVAGQIPQEQIEAQLPMIRMGLMKGMVEEVMMEQRAEELGIVADPNQVDRAIMRIREENDLLDDNAWRQALAQSGLTEAMMREQAESSLVQQQMMFQEISRQVFVGQREVAAYYEANQDQFTEPEQVLFQQIVFVFGAGDRQAERDLADNALTELRAGVGITAVGNKYRRPQDLVQDAAAASWVSPDDIQPEVRAVIETLTPLSYSDVIEGRFGYHIIQLMDRKEGRTPPLEEVAAGIDNLLNNQKMSEKLDEYTGDLIKTAGLEVYADEFDDLLSLWDEEPPVGPARTPR